MCALLFLVIAVLPGCNRNEKPLRYDELTFLRSRPIEIIDPSGLSLTSDRGSLWTVSDQRGGGVYRISFIGTILERLIYEGDDLEGITVNSATRTLYVVEERLREVREIDKRGNILRVQRLEIPGENPNDGLEGITINPGANELYVVNEKNPMLFIRLDLDDLSIIETRPIDFIRIFRITDVSGVFYDAINDEIWLLSDESKKIVVTDMNFTPVRAYRTDMTKGEGIAVDVPNKTVYIVNDDTDELFVFSYD